MLSFKALLPRVILSGAKRNRTFRPRSFATTIPLVVILERSEESRGGIVLLEDDMDEKRQAQRRRDLVPPPQKFHYVRIAERKNTTFFPLFSVGRGFISRRKTHKRYGYNLCHRILCHPEPENFKGAHIRL